MNQQKRNPVIVSVQALQRMPYYLQLLKEHKQAGDIVISAKTIATELRLNDVQVRKDLAAVSSIKGKPNTGFEIQDLIDNMEDYLGYNNVMDAVLIGAGSLGKALISYKGFENYGLNIVAAFDNEVGTTGDVINGCRIRPVSEMEEFCKRLRIHIGIITVPAQSAQAACDNLLASGILAIWNFAPVHLNAPENVLVQNENMAASLAMLSRKLKEMTR
ncbi:MAG: redox-sensing transcriptional repressor Rex [Clostridiaceae bacterium]|nr:redox-sensing transcriptional repressor Rex [Clostridiaceae bacterium]